MKKIEFFFDYLSPYSYLAWTRLRDHLALVEEQGQLILTPVILSQVIHAHDTKGPAEIAPKRDYLMKDCLRKSFRSGVAFVVPKVLPFNSLEALRISQLMCAGEAQVEVIDACYRFAWERGQDLGDFEALTTFCRDLGLDLGSLLAAIETKELRRELKAQVKRAYTLGVFGLPTFLIHEEERRELFWGHDSFDDMMNYLTGRDQFDRNQYREYLHRF